MKTNVNQRRHERVPVELEIKISEYARPTKKTTVLVTDISESGLCFESTKKLEEGSSLMLQLSLPLVVRGGLVHSRPEGKRFRYGMRFHLIRMNEKPTPPGYAWPKSRMRRINAAEQAVIALNTEPVRTSRQV